MATQEDRERKARIDAYERGGGDAFQSELDKQQSSAPAAPPKDFFGGGFGANKRPDYDQSTNTYTNPSGQKQSIAPENVQGERDRQASIQTPSSPQQQQQPQQSQQPQEQQQLGGDRVSLSQDEIDKIQSGQISAPQSIQDAVASGNFDIKEPGFLENIPIVGEDLQRVSELGPEHYFAALGVTGALDAVSNYGYNVFKISRAAKALKGAKEVVRASSSMSKSGTFFLEGEALVPTAAKGLNTKQLGLLGQVWGKVSNIGTIGGLSIAGIIGKVASGEYQLTGAQTDYSTFVDGAYNAVKEMQEAGLTTEASELTQQIVDMKDAADDFSLLQATLPGGQSRAKIKSQMNQVEADMNKVLLQIEAKSKANLDDIASFNAKLTTGTSVTDEEATRIAGLDPGGPAEQYLLTQDAVNKSREGLDIENRLLSEMANMSAQDIVSSVEILQAINRNPNSFIAQRYKQALSELQQERSRAYDVEKRDEQREFDAGLRAEENAAANFESATETETTQGSTLNFGILNSTGAKEFVNKDKASQVYYGKGYDELSQAQKQLLNLLKR